MKIKEILKIVVITSLILIIIDQASKILVNNLIDKDIEIIPNVFSITKVENEGIAFGLNKQNLGNIGISLIILVVMFNFLISQKDRLTKATVIYLSIIIAGGVSNIIDRLFKGAVFDFIRIVEFPVFNIADFCIVLGWLLFLVDFLKETAINLKAEIPVKKDKK